MLASGLLNADISDRQELADAQERIDLVAKGVR